MKVAISKITMSFPLFFLVFSLLLSTSCSTMTPLSQAAKDGDVSKIRQLLNQGVDVNDRGGDKYPVSAIHWAAYSGSIEAVNLLLESGVNVNTRDYCDQSPLIWATNRNNSHKSEMISLLISKGADPEIVDCYGCKVFNYIDYSEDKALIEVLPKRNSESEIICIYDAGFKSFKPTIDYKDLLIKLNYKGSGNIVLAVQDKRKYIISREKKPEYIGYFRHDNVGRRDDVTTPNKNPLSDELSLVIAESLKRAGYDVNEVKALLSETDKDLIEKMKQFHANRLVILTLNEWIGETFLEVFFNYDIRLIIMNEKGETIGAANIQGEDNPGNPYWVPQVRAKIYLPEAAQKHLTELLNKPEIAAALR